MRVLFQNLIANALKFIKKDNPPLIKIKGQIPTTQSEFYEIRVEDNGIGFDEKYKPLIFKPCERLHSKEEYEGTGMGLALCKKIVDRHDGVIEVESEENKGTTFIIKLPLKQP
jgi:light-regulated signal transduction histidine kinase (bacteriophytochrome)